VAYAIAVSNHKRKDMTKADIFEKVCAATGFTKKDSIEHVEQVFEALKSAL